jgi:ankyrin repeat protein
MDAALNGHVDVVRFLLDAGADANAKSMKSGHHRPLHRVVEHRKSMPKTARQVEIVKLLLEGGADVSARATAINVTPIALAAMGPEPQFLPLLLAYLDRWDLFTAAVMGEPRQVATILQRDPARANAADVNGMTALHYVAASRLGRIDPARAAGLARVAELLIAAGADVNAKVGDDPLPVIYFAAGNPPVLRQLLANGASPADAMQPTLRNADYETAKHLLDAGADVKSPRASAWVAEFVHRGLYMQARWLIERGADANGCTASDGRSALHWAAQRGASVEFAQFLLDHGADVYQRDARGATPLDLAKAKAKARPRLVDLLGERRV